MFSPLSQVRLVRSAATLGFALLLTASTALAQRPRFSRPTPADTGFTEAAPAAMQGVGVEEHRGDLLPLNLSFVDDEGKSVPLSKYFQGGKKPVILQLGYFGCPMLCSLVSKGTAETLNALTLTAGKDYEFLFVSIDPDEKPKLAAEKKQTYVGSYVRGGGAEGLHFLTGQQAEISALAKAVGFNYKWVESAGQFSHPAVILLLTPDGHISRYLYGVQFDNRTLRLSLVEASDGKIGSLGDQLLLTCFHYDGRQGKYSLAAISAMKIGGAVTVLVMAGVLTLAFRHERARTAMFAAEDAAARKASEQKTQDS